MNENIAGRINELENYTQSQSAAYREQFISIDRRFDKIEAKLSSIGVAPSVNAPVMPSPQPAVFNPPPVSQQFAQQAVSVPVPVSDGQSFRSYMSWDQRQFEDRHSASSGRTHRTLERQRPIIPRETGMLRRAAGSDAASASGAPGNRCLQHHESVMPRERSALKSNPVPGMFDAAPAEPVIERAEHPPSQQQRTVAPSMQTFAEAAQRCNNVGHDCTFGTSCMTSGNRVQPNAESVPVRVAPQISSPAQPIEQKGVNPSPQACVQYARTVPGWPVEPRSQPGFAEDL